MGTKLISAFVSVIVIGLLIFAGPAQGLLLNLSLSNSSPYKGSIIKFTANVQIDPEETQPIDELVLHLTGPESVSCTFDALGNIIEGCKGITITKTETNASGYGYGYPTPKKLTYTITLDTSHYAIGAYSTRLDVKIGDNIFSERGPDLFIKKRNRGCSALWVCSEWTPCINRQQQRTCMIDRDGCSVGQMPEEERACTITAEELLINSEISEQSQILNKQETTENASPISGVSRAVVSTTERFLAAGPKTAALIEMALIDLAFVIAVLIKTFRRNRRIVKKSLSSSSGLLDAQDAHSKDTKHLDIRRRPVKKE